MSRIKHRRTVCARFYIGLHTTSIVGAVALFVPVLQSFTTAASQSGFTTYLSLISSDGSYILSSWKDFSLSVLESMPVIETTLILVLTLIIGNALRRGIRYIPRFNHREHIALSA